MNTKKHSFPKNKIKIVLAEKIHAAAEETFREAGYQVTTIPNALGEEQLIKELSDAHVIGVRSRTHIRARHFGNAKRLLAIGCYSVGTDQVDLDAATTAGVAVFNAPHSSTRSVAELTLGNIFSLARRSADKSAKMHLGKWEKAVSGAIEVRNKTVGVIGYGHIGQQVGLLAEALGLNVLFYDVVKKLPLGRAQHVESLEELLQNVDFVTLHVPGGEPTKRLIGSEQIRLMRKGSFLLNLSRGSVVDIDALVGALKSGHLAGAALDVFPEEPEQGSAPFESELVGLENVILTPHIGGSTEEAQRNIGIEVATSLIDYLDLGSTEGAVNFPCIHLPLFPSSHRILYIHQNLPGALSEVTKIISEVGANINSQFLSTHRDIGYLIMDLDRELSEEVKEKISVLPKAIKTRILY
ncbi:MAG: phosphoglycerate dehydrogenase [Bdellovibrionota bacterium]